jgi:hypothetical protein
MCQANVCLPGLCYRFHLDTFLGEFAKLWKATTSFVMSVRVSVCQQTLSPSKMCKFTKGHWPPKVSCLKTHLFSRSQQFSRKTANFVRRLMSHKHKHCIMCTSAVLHLHIPKFSSYLTENPPSASQRQTRKYSLLAFRIIQNTQTQYRVRVILMTCASRVA